MVNLYTSKGAIVKVKRCSTHKTALYDDDNPKGHVEFKVTVEYHTAEKAGTVMFCVWRIPNEKRQASDQVRGVENLRCWFGRSEDSTYAEIMCGSTAMESWKL